MTNNEYSYSNRRYEVVSYNPDWVREFEELKTKIETIFKDVHIEHVGSTSVPGMSGKSCVDMLVIVKDLGDVETRIADMEKLGFEYSGEFVMKDSRLFRLMKDGVLLANIHFFLLGHPHIKEMLDLRNYFRTHPEEAVAYSSFKQDLYAKYPNDYASYRKEKDKYMNKLVDRVSNSVF